MLFVLYRIGGVHYRQVSFWERLGNKACGAYIEANNAATWIIWECLANVGLRVLIVWLYNNTGKSVFAATLFHAMIDVTWVLFPVYGSYYNPEITGIIIIITANIVAFLSKPKTLARYRHR